MTIARAGFGVACTLFLFSAFLLPHTARATVDQGIRIRWAGDRPAPAQSGREFVGRFELVSGIAGRIDGLEVSGPGWELRDIDAPSAVILTGKQARIVTFRAVPTDPSAPLTIRCRWLGRVVERELRLDAASLEKKQRSRRVRFADRTGPRLSGARPSVGQSGQRTSTQQIHFFGEFRYTRWDGQPQGADNIVVRVMDDDSPDPFDEEIWVGSTDATGHFEATVNWNDCDITGCDDPDIYVEIIASGPIVDVHEDDTFNTTYSWTTPVIPDFTGNEIDFGVMSPTDAIEDGAVHIYNSMVRAHRFAAGHGLAPGPFEVYWPDYDDITAYRSGLEEIHIESSDEWDELIHTHEFGHYLHDVFGNLQPSDYANGYCDDPTPGHCVWCPEHALEGWQEGFADWYGQVVTEAYPATYGYTPWAGLSPGNVPNEPVYGMDGLATCQVDGLTYPSGQTEGYVMALLRDIQDTGNDDHDGGFPDCYMDVMSLGADEILTVFKEDDPTDITMFLNAFRARYPEYDQDLWSTTQNVTPNLSFPLPDPMVLTQPAPCQIARAGDTLTLQVEGNGSLLTYRWRLDGAPITNGAGVSGADSAQLILASVSGAMSGTYDCVVTTCDGTRSVTSAATRLTIFAAPPSPRPHLTWGENYGAQCGDGTIVAELPPGSYTGLTDVVQVEGGRSYSIALKSNGTVYTWGRTESGELGNGGNGNVYSPQPIGLSNVIRIAAGNNHAVALRRDGSVVAWGWNFYGQLGDSTQDTRWVPSATKFPGCMVAIAAGHGHTLALDESGHVWAAGYNADGELGTGGSNTVNAMPQQVSGLSDVIAIAIGGYSSYALESDGTVWSWGDNSYGQLGIGNFNKSLVPVHVPGLDSIRSISASYYNAYAIRKTGEVYAWGRGDLGGIGDGSSDWRLTPVVVPGLTNPLALEAGNGGWAMALLQDGTLRAWGYNANNVLATGAPNGTYVYSHQPVQNVLAATGLGAGHSTAHVLGFLPGVAAVEPGPPGSAPIRLALRVSPVPSPSNASIAFDLPSSGSVSIAVYDVAGRLVRSLIDGWRPAGRYVAHWDGQTRNGTTAPAGVYFARLAGSEGTVTRRIVLVR